MQRKTHARRHVANDFTVTQLLQRMLDVHGFDIKRGRKRRILVTGGMKDTEICGG